MCLSLHLAQESLMHFGCGLLGVGIRVVDCNLDFVRLRFLNFLLFNTLLLLVSALSNFNFTLKRWSTGLIEHFHFFFGLILIRRSRVTVLIERCRCD